jgi:type I restriction enzyme M protein
MNAIEEDFPPLQGVLPKEYTIFEPVVLEDLLRLFDSEALRTASGDVFRADLRVLPDEVRHAGGTGQWRVLHAALAGADHRQRHRAGPRHRLDPACGSGGMFVQSSHFVERLGKDAGHYLTFYGQEKTATTIRLAKMNLAVHGLEGDIREANTFYEDVHTLVGKCDFVMANPPFNVDMVDAEKVKDDAACPSVCRG